ncbi:MAG: PorT family protein [Bacteroidetes bacterium]|nr:PorT family protein [Bacteroidota bacterium]
MKNKILLLSLILVSENLLAQSNIKVGIDAGATYSTVQGDAAKSLNGLLNLTNGIASTRNHLGFYAGLNADIPIASNISLAPGVMYSQKGYEFSGSFSPKGLNFIGADAKAVLQTNYIDVPVLLKAKLEGLQVFAGPQISYLTNASLKTTAGVFGVNLLNKTIDATSQFNKWDAGVTIGLGYEFTNGLYISGSYDYGLQKIDASKSLDAYNRSFKIGIGLHL